MLSIGKKGRGFDHNNIVFHRPSILPQIASLVIWGLSYCKLESIEIMFLEMHRDCTTQTMVGAAELKQVIATVKAVVFLGLFEFTNPTFAVTIIYFNAAARIFINNMWSICLCCAIAIHLPMVSWWCSERW